MPISLKVTPGYTHAENDTVSHLTLNALAAPVVELEDGKAANFANVTIAAGSAASPSIKIEGSLTTGLYSPAADQLGVSIGGNNVVTITSAGLTMASGKQLRGTLYADTGSKSAPGMAFAADVDCGFYLSGAAVYGVAAGTDAISWTSSAISLLLPTSAKGATFDGDVSITGKCTVTGPFSGTIDKIAAGSVGTPGLAFATDTATGIYRETGTYGNNGFGVSLNNQTAMAAFRKTSGRSMIYVGESPGTYDWATVRPAALIVHPGSGQAAVCFENADVTPGSSTFTFTNSPTAGSSAVYVKAWAGAQQVLIPCIPYNW
jgi:hypothetical protein